MIKCDVCGESDKNSYRWQNKVMMCHDCMGKLRKESVQVMPEMLIYKASRLYEVPKNMNSIQDPNHAKNHFGDGIFGDAISGKKQFSVPSVKGNVKEK